MLHIFAACTYPSDSFLGFPYWYKYLQGVESGNGCVPQLEQLTDIWLVVAALIEILLRLAGLAAIALVIYGGIQYMTSQSDPGSLEKAKKTVTNALIGLVIAVVATTLVSYLAGRFA